MALLTHVGSFSTGTGAAASTVTISGIPFRPKAVILWHTGRTDTSDAVGAATSRGGFGAFTSASDRRCLGWLSTNGGTNSDEQRGHANDACIITVDSAANIDGAYDVQSVENDGFILVVDNQLPADMRISYMAIGSDSLTDYTTGEFQEAASTGNQDITSLSFQPDCLVWFSAGISTAPSSAALPVRLSIGAATAAGEQAVWHGTARDPVGTMDTISYCKSGEVIALAAAGAPVTLDGRATFDSFLSNGFRISWTERASNRYVFFLALKGGSYEVGSLTTQTDTTTAMAEAVGFQPSGALFISHCKAESTADTVQDHFELSIGAFGGNGARQAQAVHNEDNTANAEITTAIEYDSVYANLSTSDAIEGLMDRRSQNSDGFTNIMTDADPSGAFVWYLAFGPVGQYMTPNRGLW